MSLLEYLFFFHYRRNQQRGDKSPAFSACMLMWVSVGIFFILFLLLIDRRFPFVEMATQSWQRLPVLGQISFGRLPPILFLAYISTLVFIYFGFVRDRRMEKISRRFSKLPARDIKIGNILSIFFFISPALIGFLAYVNIYVSLVSFFALSFYGNWWVSKNYR
jgi:hypothetical protein